MRLMRTHCWFARRGRECFLPSPACEGATRGDQANAALEPYHASLGSLGGQQHDDDLNARGTAANRRVDQET
jgi:hypothetical protein